jgi:hypothetical protein
MNQKVRQGERGEMVQKRGRRVLNCTGIRWRFACSSEDSGEKFLQPGGVSDRGNRGERERRGRAYIGTGKDDETGGQSIELKRRIYGEETVSGINSVQGRRT